MAETAVPNLNLFNSRKKAAGEMKVISQSFHRSTKEELNATTDKINKKSENQRTKLLRTGYHQDVSSRVTPIHLNYPPCAYQLEATRYPFDPRFVPPPSAPIDPYYRPIIPPSQYLFMADQILMGRSRSKGRSKQASPDRLNNTTTGRFAKRQCQCESQHKNHKNIVNRPYVENKKVTSKPIMKEPKKNPEAPSQTYKQVKKEINKNVYLGQEPNRNKKKEQKPKQDQRHKKDPSFVLQNRVTNQSIIVETVSRHMTPADLRKEQKKQKETQPFKIQLALPPRKQLVSTPVQTLKEAPNPVQVNRSSFLIEKVVRKIPDILDAQTFRRLLKEQDEELKKIKLQLSDDQFQIDLTDLIDSKDDYFQRSRGILVRLNQLSQDKKQFDLVNKLLNYTKKKEGVDWPEV